MKARNINVSLKVRNSGSARSRICKLSNASRTVLLNNRVLFPSSTSYLPRKQTANRRTELSAPNNDVQHTVNVAKGKSEFFLPFWLSSRFTT